jgi:hypothetical protein
MRVSTLTSSIPSEYLFLCARRKFGFNEKICRNLLIVYVYYQPNSCNTHKEHEWAGGTFLRQRKKVPPAHAQRVYLEERSEGSPHQINLERMVVMEAHTRLASLSVCLSVCPSVRLSGIPKHIEFSHRS